MSRLTDESPRLFRPTLAAWIGLNESIFLEQLHFILTEKDNKGRFADGKKWYRDTPRAFVVSYFPFWDESIVKRTIANLRADVLILARSDLNDDPKDRSLWYTINYPTLERLAGPVERITGKSAKRKEARKARRDKADSSSGYTKVQNVPLSNEDEIETEVQSVPDDKSTNCTLGSQQNVLLTQVQNVPTPKESLILPDSDTKESKSGGKPPTPPGVTVFVEVTKRHVLNNTQIKEIDERVGRDPPALEKWRETVKAWQLAGNKINNVSGMLDWFRKGIPEYAQKGHSKNGHQNSQRTAYRNQETGPPGEDSARDSISPERAAKLARLTR